MTSVNDIIRNAEAVLSENGIPEPRREATSLLCAALHKDRSFLFAHPEYELSSAEQHRFLEMIERRASHEPFHYITGTKEFYGLEFEVSPSVLIPRPETEMLVEFAIESLGDFAAPTFCEVGLGSGCISVAVLENVPHAKAVGLEISGEAVEVSRRNAARNSVDGRLDIRISDVFSGLGQGERFDIIVSNPPYIPASDITHLQPEVRDNEPRAALTDGGDGLSIIRQLIDGAPHHLRPGGILMFEMGMGQAEDVRAMFDRSTWPEVSLENDFQDIPRVALARLKDV